MIHSLAHAIGIPAHLKNVLKQHVSARGEIMTCKKSICVDSVPKWHQWLTDHSNIVGRTHRHGTYNRLINPDDGELPKGITTPKRFDEFECDIADVSGLASSKADLDSYATLNAMAEACCNDLIQPCTPAQLEKLLSHHGICTGHRAKHFDYFAKFAWDNRTFLINSDGAHHFAAARYVARRINQSVTLRAPLVHHEIDRDRVASFGDRYRVFAVLTSEYESSIRHALESFRPSFFEARLPEPLNHLTAIFLPKCDWRSRKAIQALADEHAFDLIQHLLGMANRQQPPSMLG